MLASKYTQYFILRLQIYFRKQDILSLNGISIGIMRLKDRDAHHHFMAMAHNEPLVGLLPHEHWRKIPQPYYVHYFNERLCSFTIYIIVMIVTRAH